MRGYIPPQNDEEQLLVKRVRELAVISLEKGIERQTGFLSDRQQQLAEAALSGYKGAYTMHGGYSGAERQLIAFGFGGDEATAGLISCISVKPAFSKMNDTTLTHRDFLGAFLSLGLKREMLGDIIVSENSCVAFALPRAAQLIASELSSVGRCEVRAEITSFESENIRASEIEVYTATLASLRLDAILSAMLKIIRSAAQQLTASGAVMVNHVPVASQHYEIQENDVFTVKGYGKYKLCEIGGKSRKDRVFIQYRKY